MEWFTSKLELVERIYLEETGIKPVLTPIVGAIVRVTDDHLCIGGQVLTNSKADSVLLVLTDGSEICLKSMSIDIIDDGEIAYVNATSVKGVSRVLYVRGRDRTVRVEIGTTL
jgi:hypothetical protein